MTLGDEIKKARELAGLTQPELAAIIGVSESTISNWERGRSPKNSLARVRRALRMEDPDTGEPEPGRDEDDETAEERLLRTIDDGRLWAEATRRFFRRTGSGHGHTAGAHIDVPGHLLPPSAHGERRTEA